MELVNLFLDKYILSPMEELKIGSYTIFLFSILLTLILLLPLFYLIIKVSFDFRIFFDFLFNFKILKLSINTLSLVALVVFFSIIISLPMAFLNTRSNLPYAKYLISLSVLPIALPSYVMATTQIQIWGPKGWVFKLINVFFDVDYIPSFYGLWGSTFVLSLITYPYLYIALCAIFRRFDYEMIDASRTLGAGIYKTFIKVVFPMVKPTIAAGSLIIALYVLSDFGAVSLLRFTTFTTAIFNRMYTSISNYGVLEISLLTILFCFIILFLESHTRGNEKNFSSSNLKNTKQLDLGIWKWILLPLVLLPSLLGFFIPISVLIYWLVQGIINNNSFKDLFTATLNTVSISVIASLVITFLTIPILITIRKKIKYLSLIIEKSAYVGLSLPAIVVAMSLVFFTVNYFHIAYQTFFVLIVGYFISFLPASLGPIRTSMNQINPSLEEASLTLGKNKFQTFYKVIIKLSSPSFIYATILIFILCLKELPATLILSPIGFKTLSTSIWSSASEAFFMDTAAASLLLVIIAGIPTYIFMSRGLSKRVGD